MNSQQLFEKSLQIVPGGVHSPVRSFKGLFRTPIFFKRGEGAYLYDVEGKNYIDFCMSFGPLVLGHKQEQVHQALKQGLENGWSFGACEPYSLELAEFIISHIPFIQQVRFVNSGTEAVMTALRLARGHTGRNKIVKFNGCYHGHVDSMLIKAGSGLAGEATSSSAGVSEGIAHETLIVELGDEAALQRTFELYGNDIAAVIVEPLPANNGLLIQRQEFLTFVRDLTKKHGALLIFDEVISGFRIGMGGMALETNITPDLVTYGKVIGGGMPVGAITGPKSIMEKLAPLGPVYQAGTLSANPLAMVGGLATLKLLAAPEFYQKLENQAQKIKNIFERWFKEYNHGQFKNLNFIQKGSLFWICQKPAIENACEIPISLAADFNPLFECLIEKGIYLAPNAYEVGFVSAAHDDSVLKELETRLWA